VTGHPGPLGRQVAHELARRGHAIALVYLDHRSTAEATVEEVVAAGGTAVAVRADLADDLDVERVFTETVAVFGRIDVVVHTGAASADILRAHAAEHDAPIFAARTDRALAGLLALFDRRRPR
jgi:3-oxoacyl-[acyl-carrier protein] reductase